MLLGLVSNCWRTQLDSGTPLDDLIAEASRRGYRAIELRQGSLGDYESGAPCLPDACALSELPNRFPGLRFNIAIDVPFLHPEMTPGDCVFSAGKRAAQAVAGEWPPHLRLVDLTTSAPELETTGPERAGETIVRLAESLRAIGGILSVENSRQRWNSFRAAFDLAHRQLGADLSRLRLCYDPANLLFPDDAVDPTEVTASLVPDELSMVHFKQRKDGRSYPAVCDGDIDWPSQMAALKTMHYAGPGLFEIGPHRRIWEYLAGSVNYLRRLGLTTEGTLKENG